MRQPRDGAASLNGDDPAQRALEVGLVLHVKAVELLGRHHPLQPGDLGVEQILLRPEPADRLVRIQVPAAQRVDLFGDCLEQPVDPVGALEHLVAIGTELLAVPEDASPSTTE